MENDKKPTATKWSRHDEAILVHTLTLERLSGNWRGNNPGNDAWIACKAALAGSDEKSGGAPKNITTIKNRWQRVRSNFFKYMRFLTYVIFSAQEGVQTSQGHQKPTWMEMVSREAHREGFVRSMAGLCCGERCRGIFLDEDAALIHYRKIQEQNHFSKKNSHYTKRLRSS